MQQPPRAGPAPRTRRLGPGCALAACVALAPLALRAQAPADAAPQAPVEARSGDSPSAEQSGGAAHVPERLLSNTALGERVRSLEAAIALDRRRLEVLVSREPGQDDPPLREDPELIEIAQRLPALQAELARLIRRRDARAAAGSPGPAAR